MLAEKLDPSYISLIIPSRWFSGGRESLLAEFRKHMLSSRNIKMLHAFVETRDVFPTVEIKGGLCFYLYDKSYDGDCNYILTQDGADLNSLRNLGDFDILIRDPYVAKIVKKVMDLASASNTVDTLISGDTPFGVPTNPSESAKNPFDLYDEPTPEHNTQLLYLNKMVRTIGFVNRNAIKKNVEDIDRFKVFIPKASGSGTDPYVIGKPEFGARNSVCSQTFLYAAFDEEAQAKNFITYLRSKFFRFLVSASKISQETPSKVYRFVPIQDFSKPWTDEELYAQYGLNDEEIAFIESTIKPLE